jgi:hypothetical protein
VIAPCGSTPVRARGWERAKKGFENITKRGAGSRSLVSQAERRRGFQAEGQAGIWGGMSAAVLRSGAEGKRGVESEQKPLLSGRG